MGRLLVLWILSERSSYGYEIKKALGDDATRFWFGLDDASIYSALRTSTKHGHAREVGTEREGRRPTRTRYAITPTGRRHYRELLLKALSTPTLPTAPIDVALAAPSGEGARRAPRRRPTGNRARQLGTRHRAPQAMADLIAEGPERRAEYFGTWVEERGGTLLGYYFADSSSIDIVTLCEFPDEMGASAAASIATWGSTGTAAWRSYST